MYGTRWILAAEACRPTAETFLTNPVVDFPDVTYPPPLCIAV
jgi:hypothetical protein